MELLGNNNLENDKQTQTKKRNPNKTTKILKQTPLISLGNSERTVVV